MEFDWDDGKNRENIRKHGLDFADAPMAFDGPVLARLDTRQDYGEDRWVGIGLIHGRVVVLVFAQPRPEAIRVISLRKATKRESMLFEREVVRKLWNIEEN